MKRYVSPDRLQFVGKAWEIRHTLRKLLRQEALRKGTLKAYLHGMCDLQ